MNENPQSAEVKFFRGRAKRNWLATLILALIFSVGIAVCIIMVPITTSRILLSVALVACVAIVVMCLLTLKLRTSKWTIDESGVKYSACGHVIMSMSWDEVADAGFFKTGAGKKAVYYLFWSKEEIGFLQGNMAVRGLKDVGKHNRRGARVILYELDPNIPDEDALLLATREWCKCPIANAELLDEAIAAAD